MTLKTVIFNRRYNYYLVIDKIEGSISDNIHIHLTVSINSKIEQF